MKKFLPLIEQYVQWVALGLGALYVFYMVYAYVIVPPVTTEVGNRTVDLGSVDKVTREGPAADLERAIQTGASADALGQISVQPVVPKFVATITNANDPLAKATMTASNWNAPVLPPVIPGMPGATPGRTPGVTSPGGVASANPPQVAEIVIPAATFVGVSTGRSSVVPPPPPANGGVAAGGNPAAQQPAPVQPVQPVQQIQPVQGVAGAAGVNPNNPNNVPTVDKNWVSFHYKIPSAGLNAAFQKAGVPSVRRVTSFLRVELVRQEKLPGGGWGEEQTVQPLQIAFQNAPAWPAGPAAGAQMQQDYITWAQANAQSILQPVFYQVVKGDIPGVPGDPVLHVGMPLAQEKPFDPANPGLPPPGGFTPQQKQAIIDYRKQKALEQRQNRPTRTNRRPTRGGRGEDGGDIAFAPRDAARPTAFYQVRTAPGYRRPGVDVPEDMVMEDMGDGMGGGGVVTQQNNAALNLLAQTIPQPNLFDPAQLTVDVDVIAYDETAEPGKTYRYRMQYYVLNPILGAINLVKNPQQAKDFSIASAPTEWSAPVDITPAVNFFLAAGGLVGDSVKLDIFKWQNGDVNKATQTVTAGDRVGLTDKNGVDFMTPWTIVDVRVGNGDRYVLLQDDKGNRMRREFRVDQNNPLHRDLDAQVAAAQAAAAAAAAAANPNGTAGGIQPTGGNFTR